VPEGRFVELSGNDHLLWLGDWEGACDAIEEFVVGEQRVRDPDRVLSTVLFTDISRRGGFPLSASAIGLESWHLAETGRVVRSDRRPKESQSLAEKGRR